MRAQLLWTTVSTVMGLTAGARIGHVPSPFPFSLHNTSIDGLDLFWREAGETNDKTILLLHGSPDSSFGYRNLIPYLASAGYHVFAPDFPGFGFSVVPASRNYTYDLDAIATTIDIWLQSLDISTFAMYITDIGGPIGFQLALSGRYNIPAIVDQNAAITTSAFGPGIEPLIEYGNHPHNTSARRVVVESLAPQGIIELFLTGASDPVEVAPESYTVPNAWLAKPGSVDVGLAALRSFVAKIAEYPTWQAWLRKHQPSVLAIWGKNDPAQVPAGAHAFKRYVPDAEVVLVDAGHFALETALLRIGSTMVSFLRRSGL